jgi:hypothetical protein
VIPAIFSQADTGGRTIPNELTIPQFAQLALGKTENPLHLGDILSAYNEKVMFLKSTMTNLSKAQAFMFVTMLSRPDVANLLGNTPSAVQYSISQFRTSIQAGYATYWTQWANLWLSGSQASGDADSVPPYGTLASVLKSVGASIFYLSPEVSLPSNIPNLGPGTMPPWTVIGIVGTFAGLANLNGLMMPFWPGGANGWSAQDWDTIESFASGGNDLLLAPAQEIPAIWRAAQGQVNNLPYANMMLLKGS